MVNEIILSVLTIAYLAATVSGVTEYMRRESNKKKMIPLPSAMLWVSLICGIAMLIIAWFAAKQDGSLGLTICFGIPVLLCIFLMIGWKNCYLLYDGSGFTQKTFWGRQHNYTYAQVTAWRFNTNNPMDSSIYMNGRKISFNLLSKNGTDFLHTVNAKYRKTHNNQSLPELPSPNQERRGFCAHVLEPGQYLLVFIMMLFFIIGSCIWIVVDTWLPVSEDDAEQFVITFVSWEIDDTTLVLTSPQVQETFHIDGYENHLTRFRHLASRCNGATSFTLWAERINPKNDDPYYRVYELSSGSEIYRSFPDSTAHNRETIPLILRVYGIILGIVLGFSALIYAVGCCPQRFPKWLVYACFRKSAIYF